MHLKEGESLLLHHYVNHVTVTLMPLDVRRNPWKSLYPALALVQGQEALFNAVLAHAASSMAQLGHDSENMSRMAGKHYLSAMQNLRKVTGDECIQYGSFLATVLTMLFVEAFHGNTNKWRTHFNGAWDFLRNQNNLEQWTTSELAWSTTQSFCLLKIIIDTSFLDSHYKAKRAEDDIIEQSLLSSVSSNSAFGFTMCVSRSVLLCISDITKIANQIRSGRTPAAMEAVAESMCRRLEECRTAIIVPEGDAIDDRVRNWHNRHRMAQHHLWASIAGAYIYMYRSWFNRLPCDIADYTTEVLSNMASFIDLGDGIVLLWPLFIAAVETYETKDILTVRRVMNNQLQLGLQNRVQVNALLEEIWRLRHQVAQETDTDIGKISLDWRHVTQSLGMDVLPL